MYKLLINYTLCFFVENINIKYNCFRIAKYKLISLLSLIIYTFNILKPPLWLIQIVALGLLMW